MDKIISRNSAETERLARQILKKVCLKKADKPVVFLLKGELGGGKTVFVKGLAKALGIKERVTSPTFILFNTYETKQKYGKLVHWDLYRIESEKELEIIGFWDIVKDAGIVCIEWPENMGKKYLEKIKKEMGVIEIEFEYGKKIEERVIKIEMNG